MPRDHNLTVRVDFSIAEATFRETGPVSIAFSLNGKLLEKLRYENSGEKRFEKSVPDGWVKRGENATLAFEIDPVYVSPTDGARLGVILTRAGFAR